MQATTATLQYGAGVHPGIGEGGGVALVGLDETVGDGAAGAELRRRRRDCADATEGTDW